MISCFLFIAAISSLPNGNNSDQHLTVLMECENSYQVDQKITADVRQAIQNISKCEKNITVSTSNGVVTLRGTLANEKDKTTVVQKAKAVRCVKRVDVYIAIDPNC